MWASGIVMRTYRDVGRKCKATCMLTQSKERQ